jgi:serine/threonine protein kinase
MTTPFEGFSQLAPGAPTEVGRYRLYARLGVGGMGQVYLSFLPGGRPVALKVVREEFAADPEFRRRFAQEARAAQQVNGIHIAQLLDADPQAPTPWLATAYIPGPSLLEAVRLHGPLPVESVRVLIAGIAQALAAIHAAGLIHRDLKPANVILAADGPRVIDFGIARAADATTASLTGRRIGSPQYMAPEQVRGLSATPALDVFALGALAFFAATGRPAFGEGEDLAIIFRVVQEQPDLTGCPPELLEVIAACLAKDPAARPDTRAVFEACRAMGTRATTQAPDVSAGRAPHASDAAGGWLPPEIAQSIHARGSAIAAIGAQPPPAPQPPHTPTTPPQTGPTQPTATAADAAAPHGLAVRLKVGAITLGIGVVIGAVLVFTVFRPTSGTVSASGGTHSPTPRTSTSTGPVSTGAPGATDSGSPSPADSGSQEVGQGGPLGTSTASPFGNVGSDTVQWQGAITFGKGGVDLEGIPPGDSPAYPDLAYVGSSNSASGYNFSSSWGMAQWTGSGVPSRSQCVSLVGATHGTGLVLPENSLVCVKTLSNLVALVQIQGVDTTNGIVSAYARVWADAA